MSSDDHGPASEEVLQPPDALPPTGRNLHLQFQDQEADVSAVGATLRGYRVAGRDLLDGYPDTSRSTDGRGQLLLPWPNRIDGGRYQFEGVDYELPLTEPSKSNAIHGLARWLTWTVESVDKERVRLSLVIYPQPGYDFTLGLIAEYRLGLAGLSVTVAASNLGDTTLPYGSGAHPYFTLGTPLVDELWVQMDAATRLPNNDRGIPTGEAVPVQGTEYDFRQPRQLGPQQLDTAFTDLGLDAEGMVTVELSLHDAFELLRVWADPQHRYLMLFTGDSLPDSSVRRRGLGLEPMTCAPNAFRSGQGLIKLAPGASRVTRWGIELRRQRRP
jgi:aldose 1-epimerase